MCFLLFLNYLLISYPKVQGVRLSSISCLSVRESGGSDSFKGRGSRAIGSLPVSIHL